MSEQIGNESGSWFMQDSDDANANRPRVFVSHATAGEPRDTPNGSRYVAAGNMSENWPQPDRPEMPKEDFPAAARERVQRFIESLGLEPGYTAIVRPQKNFDEPLGITNVDTVLPKDSSRREATWLEDSADMIFTRDPDRILGCRPADCPVAVFSGEDRDGAAVLALLHMGWQSLNAGYAEQGLAFLRDGLGVDLSRAKVHLAPGARVEAGNAERSLHYQFPTDPLSDASPRFTHPERDSLFVNVKEMVKDDGTTVFDFDIDAFGFLRRQMREAGVRDENVYEDTSNTITPESGYSSNSRAANNPDREVNTRDLVVATLRPNAGVVQHPSSS